MPRPAASVAPRDYRAEWKARQESRALSAATKAHNKAMRDERVRERIQPTPKQITNDRSVAMALERTAAWQAQYDRRRDAEKRLGLLPANDTDERWHNDRVGQGFHRGAQGVCAADLVRAVESKHDPRAELLESAAKGDGHAIWRAESLFGLSWRSG